MPIKYSNFYTYRNNSVKNAKSRGFNGNNFKNLRSAKQNNMKQHDSESNSDFDLESDSGSSESSKSSGSESETEIGSTHSESELNKPFTVVGGGKLNKQSMVKFDKTSEQIKNQLCEITNNEDYLYDDPVKFQELFDYYESIKSIANEGDKTFIYIYEELTKVFEDEIKIMNELLLEKKITFNNLSKLFCVGKEIIANTYCGEKIAGIIIFAKNINNTFENKTKFEIKIKTYFFNGIKIIEKKTKLNVEKYSGLKSFDELKFKLIDENDKLILKNRGIEYLKYSKGCQYKFYKGNAIIYDYYDENIQLINATGRIMIDVYNNLKQYPDSDDLCEDNKMYCQNLINIDLNNGNDGNDFVFPEDKLHLLWPFLKIFSFKNKCWAEIPIKNISDIKFDDDAYDCLVLNEDKKTLVKNLVKNYKKSTNDIISNKNGGCIFLLHGTPGTGKTLTAESIAELLHVPLYSITSGELGTVSTIVESKLMKILNIAQEWNAVILIDEADVFLEKRQTSDLERNAIVGIFLRLLERFDGIMFLTTNRKTEIDPAFQSRISVSFEYDYLNEDEKVLIFKNLLQKSNITLDSKSIEKYAKLQINGRQIKNLIKLAYTTSIEENIPTNSSHFEKVIEICNADYRY